MILHREALSILEETARLHLMKDEAVALEQSMGRILSRQVLSPEDVPSFANSAMDGFAVFSSDTSEASPDHPVTLPVNGIVGAGDAAGLAHAQAVGQGQAIEIMTGAPVPGGGHDSVVRIEDVTVTRTATGVAQAIVLHRPSPRGANIRLSGTDFHVGQVVLNPGDRVGASHVLACASLGIATLTVKAKPRVAVLSTGSALVSPREVTLAPGMIRNSTGPYLHAALRQLGADSHYLGIVADEPARYRKMLEQAIQDGADVIVSTGAVSMGKYDFVSDVLKQMNAKIHFHKASIRPGKPILFAEVEFAGRWCAIFGVPGNPVSTAGAQRFFIEPYLRAAQSLAREEPLRIPLKAECTKPEGLRCFYKGSARISDHHLEAAVLKGQASYVVSELLDASCWVVLPEEGRVLPQGSLIDVYPLNNAFERGVLS